MSDAAEQIENCFVDGMPNENYHDPALGVSTSTLKLFLECPSLVVWNAAAPKNEAKMQAINFGSDFHSYFLEPDLFAETHQVLPPCNRRKKDEKEAELLLIDEWKQKGIIPVTAEDIVKLEGMRESALSHPTVAQIMAMDGIAERSYFWVDKKTGLKCKCRPDLTIENITDANRPVFMPKDCDTLLVDAKTCGDFDRMQGDIERLGYYIQDRFYSRGVEAVSGGKVCFLFVFVSTSLSIGRYPVRTVLLSDTAKFDGDRMIDDALDQYARLAAGPELGWCTAQTIDRPHWAIQQEMAEWQK